MVSEMADRVDVEESIDRVVVFEIPKDGDGDGDGM